MEYLNVVLSERLRMSLVESSGFGTPSNVCKVRLFLFAQFITDGPKTISVFNHFSNCCALRSFSEMENDRF